MSEILVQVPLEDADDLTKLVAEVGQPQEITRSRPFDGEVLAQIVLYLSPVSYPYFRLWVKTRAESRKQYKVVTDGVTLAGYTASEVGKILNATEKLVTPEVSDDDAGTQ